MRSLSSASSADSPVAVVGGGIGGLALALALQRADIDCRVFERRADDAADGSAGAGLQVTPNAMRLLDRLGVGPQLRAEAVRPERFEMSVFTGQTILRINLAECEERFGAPLLTMRRQTLHATLRAALADGTLTTGARLNGLDAGPESVTLRFSDGAVATAGVVAGADGVHSTVRGEVADVPLEPSGMVAYRGLCDSAALAGAEPRVRMWFGRGPHVIAYPVDRDGTVSFAAIVPAASGKLSDGPGPADRLLTMFEGWPPEVRAMLAAGELLGRWELYERTPAPDWVSGRVALLGDAAHPILPQLAQGANQAIEDAVALAGCLSASPSPETALRAYEAVRAPRFARVQAAIRARGGPPGANQRALSRVAAAGSLATAPDGVDPYLTAHGWLYGYDVEDAVAAVQRALA